MKKSLIGQQHCNAFSLQFDVGVDIMTKVKEVIGNGQ